MKYIILLIFLMKINLLLAQDNVITAGIYDTNMFYYDYNPDTVLPYGNYYIYSSSINIDLNFDSIADFEIYNLNADGNSGYQFKVTITPFNDNEVNYRRIDSIYYPNQDTTIYYHIPKPFNFGEEINDSYLYTSDVSYLYRHSSSSISGFSHEIFDWDNIGDKYLGIRMNINDTLYYGWVRLEISTGSSNGGSSEVTVMEYALSKSLQSGIFDNHYRKAIAVYPNPVKSDLNIDLPENINSGNITIIDLNGAIRRTIRISNSGFQTIHMSDLETGFYMIRVVSENNMYYSRIIKL